MKNPSTYQAYVYLTLCNQELGNYEDALYACQKAMLMKPNDTMIGYYLSRCYLQFEIYDQAVKKIKDAIQFDQNKLFVLVHIGGSVLL